MWQVKNIVDGKFYAMRSINKTKLQKEGFGEILENETKVLKVLNFPYAEKFTTSFQSDKRIYILTEYIDGGYMTNLLSAKGKLSEEYSILYAAEIVLVLEYLHEHNIIHRDLKSQNIVIDENGHIRLINFWKAKALEKPEIYSTTYYSVYSAPEVLKEFRYSKASDWWNLVSIFNK